MVIHWLENGAKESPEDMANEFFESLMLVIKTDTSIQRNAESSIRRLAV